MAHAKLRVSLCQAQEGEKLRALQIISTRTVDVLAVSQAHTVLSVLERAFGRSLATACFTAQKNYDVRGQLAVPKTGHGEEAPLIAVEDVIQMGINFASNGVRAGCTVALFRAPVTLLLTGVTNMCCCAEYAGLWSRGMGDQWRDVCSCLHIRLAPAIPLPPHNKRPIWAHSSR